jgi:TATA-binding protein-associated factor
VVETARATRSTLPVHAFQALQYLRRLCFHAQLVLKPSNAEYKRIVRDAAAELKQAKQDGDDDPDAELRALSPKLLALRDLLHARGIGVDDDDDDEAGQERHRVLVFAQLKDSLNLIEQLFASHMPTVKFSRIDGSVQASERFRRVQQFNAAGPDTDDVMLLTTRVGGLGLNLASADTVMVVENDWNPLADLQAMERAHRIGQRRVVNVYRLIMRNTLEEDILGMQNWKIQMANTVIGEANKTVGTDLDTSTVSTLIQANRSSSSSSSSSSAEKKKKNAMTLGDAEAVQVAQSSLALGSSASAQLGGGNGASSSKMLWDEAEYAQFSLDGFLTRLNATAAVVSSME